MADSRTGADGPPHKRKTSLGKTEGGGTDKDMKAGSGDGKTSADGRQCPALLNAAAETAGKVIFTPADQYPGTVRKHQSAAGRR